MDSLQVIRLWAATAWADEELHSTESAALQRLIDASEDLSAADRQEALSFLETAPTVDLEEIGALDPIDREGVYRAAIQIVMLDGRLVDAERSFLEKLRGVLDLDEAKIKQIETDAK